MGIFASKSPCPCSSIQNEVSIPHISYGFKGQIAAKTGFTIGPDSHWLIRSLQTTKHYFVIQIYKKALVITNGVLLLKLRWKLKGSFSVMQNRVYCLRKGAWSTRVWPQFFFEYLFSQPPSRPWLGTIYTTLGIICSDVHLWEVISFYAG